MRDDFPGMTVEEIIAAAVSGVADFVHETQATSLSVNATGIADYPKDHKAGMKVPKGGSSCASCEYLEGKDKCNNRYFIQWNGSKDLPAPADEYCSDWWEQKKEVKAAEEVSLGGDQKGSLWHGIRIIGFTGPEEEGLRAKLSRIPPELFTGIDQIKSAKELNAKHGKYIPEERTMLFNPSNFSLRQRFGQGDGWIWHDDMTVVHEVGHAIYESLSSDKKLQWLQLGGWRKGWKIGQAPAYVETRKGWGKDNPPSQWTHKLGLKFPRHYSERNANECFADCFAFYILNKAHQLEQSMKKFMDELIKDRVKKYPQASIESPDKPYTEQIKKRVSV